MPDLMECVGRLPAFGHYHEPFVGGGALFFELFRKKLLGEKKVYLSDGNPNLIDAYRGLKEDVEGVIALLMDHASRHSEEYYYEVRACVPEELIARAARIIYLNKTCYNGLYRENSRGGFNVPFGRYVNPAICDEENLRAASEALKKADVETRSFERVLEKAQPGDLVYFDPPYHPVSKTASFTAYAKGGFGEDAQRQLAEVFGKLAERNVHVLLSNSKTSFVDELYGGQGYEIRKVLASRTVNSRAGGRGKVSEALIANF